MSSEFILSTLPFRSSRDSEEEEEEEEEKKVLCDSSEKECDEIGTNEDRNKAKENSEHGLEEPKEGMIFDTANEAYLYYSRYAKEKGFAVAKRNSRKEKNENLRHVTFQCNRGGKAKVTTTNPVKPRPQTKIECPARLNLSRYPDGKWRLNRATLEHNHENSPTKSRFHKSYRVLDEQVKKKLILNDKAGIRLHKTIKFGEDNQILWVLKFGEKDNQAFSKVKDKGGEDNQAITKVKNKVGEEDNNKVFWK